MRQIYHLVVLVTQLRQHMLKVLLDMDIKTKSILLSLLQRITMQIIIQEAQANGL